MTRTIILLTLAGLVACTGSPTPDCIVDNPATTDADFASDMWHTGCPVALGTATTTPPCDPPTVADIEAQCAAEGAPCDGTITVGHDAALCLAEDDGLAAGLDGLHADLMFNSRFDVPIWAVSNVLTDSGGASSGESVTIDAATGDVLENSQWDRSP
jgi:hypothetical protein